MVRSDLADFSDVTLPSLDARGFTWTWRIPDEGACRSSIGSIDLQTWSKTALLASFTRGTATGDTVPLTFTLDSIVDVAQ